MHCSHWLSVSWLGFAKRISTYFWIDSRSAVCSAHRFPFLAVFGVPWHFGLCPVWHQGFWAVGSAEGEFCLVTSAYKCKSASFLGSTLPRSRVLFLWTVFLASCLVTIHSSRFLELFAASSVRVFLCPSTMWFFFFTLCRACEQCSASFRLKLYPVLFQVRSQPALRLDGPNRAVPKVCRHGWTNRTHRMHPDFALSSARDWFS